MTQARPIRILFLCTGNSCRSQMAEAMLNHLADGRFEALSAGTEPAGFVHQLAIDTMERMGIAMTLAESKSVDVLRDEAFDAAITLCDNAASRPCPVFTGAPIRAHWPLPDPTFHPGTTEERLAFTRTVAKRLMAKIEALMRIDWTADRAGIEAELQRIGQI